MIFKAHSVRLKNIRVCSVMECVYDNSNGIEPPFVICQSNWGSFAENDVQFCI